MTSQDLALRSSIPPVLADLGVTVQERDGLRVVEIPDAIREKCNVLLPVSEITQADPDWTPSFRAVKLNPAKDGPHFYDQQGKLAPRKEALGLLSELAGVEYINTERIPRDQLAETESFGMKATIAIRRSDGRVATVTATKTFDQEVEHRKVITAVDKAMVWENGRSTGKPKFPEGPARDAEIHKRWLQEREHGPRKVESKAINAAIRQVLHLPHTFTAQDAAKPFLVVGYQFTPDTTDPEIRRIVIEAGMNASRQLYAGAPAAVRPDVEASPASTPATEGEGGRDDTRGTASDAQHESDPAPTTDEQPSATEDGTDENAFDGDEPETQTSFQVPEGAADPEVIREGQAAGLHVVGFGKHAGHSIADIANTIEGGEGYVRWLATQMDPRNVAARDAKAAAATYVRVLLGEAS